MKKIHVVVHPQLLRRLHEVLHVCPGFPSMMVAEVNVYPSAASQAGTHSIREDLAKFVPHARIEIVASDALANVLFESAVKALEHGQTGKSILWMTDVIQVTFLHRTG